MTQVTSHEEFLRLRQTYVVERVYSGNDSLPLETKDVLLREALGDPQYTFYSTTVNEEGIGKSVHVPFKTRVTLLELDILDGYGYTIGTLC